MKNEQGLSVQICALECPGTQVWWRAGGSYFNYTVHKLNEVYFNKMLEGYSPARAAKENDCHRLTAPNLSPQSQIRKGFFFCSLPDGCLVGVV